MSIKAWVYIVFIWVILNALLPILFRSVERIYQPQIDFLVKGLVSILRWVVLRLLQIILIGVCLPSIVSVPVLEHIYPKIFSIKYFSDMRIGMRSLFRKDFWDLMAKAYKEYKELKKTETKKPTGNGPGYPKVSSK